MPFKKGQSGNAKGKAKGTQNRLTKELRELMKSVIYDELENLPSYIHSLKTDKDRLEILIKLLPFVLPKVEAVEMNKGEAFMSEWETL